ncbi:hypothetical protein CKO51_03380 [Rhodopirellula sp. SM50]|nr:hypothetical protein [Rhodopirellula sp. SM50]PAY20933.1 hypothetical protein CKO51_03380 [Rhodopirellula sp. SM50]
MRNKRVRSVTFQLASGVRFQLATAASFQLASGVSFQLATAVSFQLASGVSFQLATAASSQLASAVKLPACDRRTRDCGAIAGGQQDASPTFRAADMPVSQIVRRSTQLLIDFHGN